MSNITELNEVLTLDDVAELLICDVEEVQTLAERGELPGVKYGAEWVFPQSALYKVLHVQALKLMEHRRGRSHG